MTLISAPAGFGKTTLLAEWLAAMPAERSVAWLSLEESDSRPASYWTYLTTALQAVVPGVGGSALQLLQSAQLPIETVLTEAASLEITDDRLVGVRLADGTVVGREALAVSPRMVARAGFLAALGLRPAEHPSGTGGHVPSDPTGRTEAPGVWVAGNVTT